MTGAIDKVAAVSEETSAAAEELQAAVSQFRVGDGEGAELSIKRSKADWPTRETKKRVELVMHR